MIFRSLIALAFVAAGLAAVPAGAGGEAAPNTLTAREVKDGWKLLFDGKSLDGWRVFKRKDTKGWTVKDGAIFLEKPGSGDLLTDAQYGNFEFSVDWKFADGKIRGNNSGIIYRAGEQGAETWVTGPEMQVMNEPPDAKLNKNSGGALYDLYAPKTNALKPGSEWNTFKIVANGKHLEQWVNGVKVVDADIGSPDWNKRIAKSKWKNNAQFASLPSGHIALQDHGAQIAFRNVKLKVLREAGAR
jgi:hypothetical protein